MQRSWYSWINPWTCARNVFRPKSADVDAPFQRLSDWRARIGLLSILVLSLPDPALTFVPGDRLVSAGVSFIVSGFVAAAFVGIYLRQHVDDVAPAARTATNLVLVRSGTMATYLLIMVILVFTLPESAEEPAGPGIIIVPALWIAIFTVSMIWYSLRWVYGISSVTPILGPATSAVTAVVAFVVDAIVDAADPRPDGTQQILKYFALGSVLALSWAEAYYLRRGGEAAFSSWVSPPRFGFPGEPGHRSGRPTPGARVWTWLAGPPEGVAIAAFAVAWCLPVIGFIVALIAVLRVQRNPIYGGWLPACALIVSVAWPITYATAIR